MIEIILSLNLATKGDQKNLVAQIDDWNFLGNNKKIWSFDQWPLSIEWLKFFE
jgi:hypothetical protein